MENKNPKSYDEIQVNAQLKSLEVKEAEKHRSEVKIQMNEN